MNTKPAEAIAIFGGTFDPIHYGHMFPAIHAAQWLKLDTVNLLPANIPPHKAKAKVENAHRVTMLELACQHYPIFTIDDRELSKNTPSYTVETLREYRSMHPNARLYFFVGMDSLLTFTTWYQWQEILSLCHLVVTTRPGYDSAAAPDEIKELLQQYEINLAQAKKVLAGGIIIAPPIAHDVSSTQIRGLIASEQDITPYTLDTIASYITTQKLYQK